MKAPKQKNTELAASAKQTEQVTEAVQTAEPKPSKTVTGTIIRHGEDHYQFDPSNDLNYFVEIETKQGKYEMLWGVNLKGLVESQQLEVGEKASFHKFKREDGSKYAANQWEAERYFEEEKLENIIEPDFEQDKVQEKSAQTADQASEFGQSKVKQSADYGTDDAEYIVPNAIRNRYLSVAVNKHTDSPMVKFYERENPASVAFEDRGDKGLHTSKSDKDTVNAMLDMAQSKGWESIKLKGSAEFKREAWIEAQMRGIKTKGYEPTEKDKLELQARQEERTTNQIEATKIGAVYTKEADKTSLDHAKDAGIAVGTSVAMGDNLTAATAVQAIVTDKVQSLAADVVIDQVAHEQTTDEQQDQSDEQDINKSSTWHEEKILKEIIGKDAVNQLVKDIDNKIAAIQPDYETFEAEKAVALAEAPKFVQRALERAEKSDVQVDSFDDWLAKRNIESTPERRIEDKINSKIHRFKVAHLALAQENALLKNENVIENYMNSIQATANRIAVDKAQLESGHVHTDDLYDYGSYIHDTVTEVEIVKMQEDYDNGRYEQSYDLDDELDAFDNEHRIAQAEGRDDVPHGAATEADVQRHNENFEKMLRESQAADRDTDFMADAIVAEDMVYDEYMHQIKLLEAQAKEKGIEVEGFEKYVEKLNESYGNTAADRIQQEIDEVSQDPQAAGYLKGWDYDTEAGKEAYSHWLAVMQAEKSRGVSEVEMSDYISSLQDRIREFDADAELTDEVLYEKYNEDLENGEISASMSWEDYRDDWREAFAEADREKEIAEEQHRDLKEVETEAYVRAEEFQRGRDIDPDLDMNVAGEAERFKSNVVSAPKVAGMTQAKVTQKVEAAFDRKIDGSMAAAKRDDFKKDFEENKAKLSDNDKVKVEAMRRMVDYLHKDNPKELQAGYEKLTTAMKNGEISKLPDAPQQVVQQSIEIQAPTQSNKDRGR